jgi:hypothetical protein
MVLWTPRALLIDGQWHENRELSGGYIPTLEVGVAVKLWAKQVVAMLYAVPDEHWTSIVDCRAPESRRLILGIRGWTVCSRWSKGLG